MNFWTAVTNLFVGRLNRMQYAQAIFIGLILPALVFVALLVLLTAIVSIPASVSIVIFVVALVVVTFLFYGIHARRLHDMGMPGWYALIPILREVSFVVGFFLPGKQEDTEYGSVPKTRNLFLGSVLNLDAKETDTGERWIAGLIAVFAVLGLLFALFAGGADHAIQQGDEQERFAWRALPLGALPTSGTASIEEAVLMYFAMHGHECVSAPETDYLVSEGDFILNYGDNEYLVTVLDSCDGPLAVSTEDTPHLVLSKSGGTYRFIGELMGTVPYVKEMEQGRVAADLLTISGGSSSEGYAAREWKWNAQGEYYVEQRLTEEQRNVLHEEYAEAAVEEWNSTVD